MNYEDLKSYFETYVIKYLPYTEYDSYRSLIEYIENVYLNDSYCTIPAVSKLFVESNIISKDSFDDFLISAGLPPEIVSTLTVKDKEILVTAIQEYNKYKATIYSIESMCSVLSNEVSIYELFITRKDGRFYFYPVPVYLSETARENPYARLDGRFYNYQDIYLRARYYYVTEQELDYLYQTNQITLPIKSNLIIFDYMVSYDDTSLYKRLLESIVINHFRDTIVNVIIPIEGDTDFRYFCSSLMVMSEELMVDVSTSTFNLSLVESIILYYYIYLKYYNAIFPVLPHVYEPVVSYDLSSIRFSISDLENLIELYNKIENVNDATQYYNQFIRDVFSIYISNAEPVTIDEIESRIKSYYPNLINVIDTIMDYVSRYPLISKFSMFQNILLGIKNSIRTFAYTIENETIKNILLHYADNLPIIQLSKPDGMPVYEMVMYYKPFHTQVIDISRVVEVSNDLFNLITPDDFERYTIRMDKPSTNLLSDYNEFAISNIKIGDSNVVTSHGEFVVVNPVNENVRTSGFDNELIPVEPDTFQLSFKLGCPSVNILSDDIMTTRFVSGFSDSNIILTRSNFSVISKSSLTDNGISFEDYFNVFIS